MKAINIGGCPNGVDEDDAAAVKGEPEMRAEMPKKTGEWGPRRRM